MRFFFEIPRIEELQDSNSSPRRGEVGRPTLRDYGGFLLSFFYRARFQLFTQQFPMFVERLQKLPLRSLTTPLAGFAGGVLVWPHGSPYRIRRTGLSLGVLVWPRSSPCRIRRTDLLTGSLPSCGPLTGFAGQDSLGATSPHCIKGLLLG